MPKMENQNRIGHLGGVILCGGQSRRMGMDKNELVFQEKTFLEQVYQQVQQVCGPVVLVGNLRREHHEIPDHVHVLPDEQTEMGPLEGIRVGLRWLSDQVEVAFVTGCDTPLLRPELIKYLFTQLGNFDVVVPVHGKSVYGTTAIYRTTLYQSIGQRIAENLPRVSDLAMDFNSNQISLETLKDIDPNLNSFVNVNTAAQYMALLERFQLECPAEIARRLNRN